MLGRLTNVKLICKILFYRFVHGCTSECDFKLNSKNQTFLLCLKGASQMSLKLSSSLKMQECLKTSEKTEWNPKSTKGTGKTKYRCPICWYLLLYLFCIGRRESDTTSSEKLFTLYKPSSQSSPRAPLACWWNGMLLECLVIIIAFISCKKSEQQLIWSAAIQTVNMKQKHHCITL